MDIATIIGVVLAMSLILGSIVIGGGSLMSFVDAPSLMVVIGGAIAAGMISFPIKNFRLKPELSRPGARVASG